MEQVIYWAGCPLDKHKQDQVFVRTIRFEIAGDSLISNLPSSFLIEIAYMISRSNERIESHLIRTSIDIRISNIISHRYSHIDDIRQITVDRS